MDWRRRYYAVLPLLLVALLPSGCRTHRQLAIDDLVVEHQVPLQWSELEPGLSFARLEYHHQNDNDRVVVAAVRAEPTGYDFELLDAPDLLKEPRADVDALAVKAGVTAAGNASFYLPETFNPNGLIVAGRKVKNEWKKGGGSGVFWVKDGKAVIDWSRTFRPEWEQADLAVQAGPLVIEPDGLPGIRSNTGKYEARTIIGLDDRQRVVLACTLREDGNGERLRGLDLYELMRILSVSSDRGGRGLRSALNLDGGVSTGFFLKSPRLSMMVKVINPVRNGIGLRPRGKPWK